MRREATTKTGKKRTRKRARKERAKPTRMETYWATDTGVH